MFKGACLEGRNKYLFDFIVWANFVAAIKLYHNIYISLSQQYIYNFKIYAGYPVMSYLLYIIKVTNIPEVEN